MRTKKFICGCGNIWLWIAPNEGKYTHDPCGATTFTKNPTCNNVYVYDSDFKLINVYPYHTEQNKTI